jgi:ATP sulfurylase
MKKLAMFLLFAVFTMFAATSNAQSSLAWDTVITVNKTKDQLYTDTKMFIAEKWNSAQNVIQSDDKEAGTIVCVGAMFCTVINGGVNIGDAIYRYVVKFYVKDNKCRIVISDISWKSGPNSMWTRYLATSYDTFPGIEKCGLNEKN